MSILQYFLIFIMCVSALLVLISHNHVHSVMFLITTFISAAIITLNLGAEFIGFILIIVYVGAIAVLFLFIVMMLNIKINKTAFTISQYVPIFSFFVAFAFVCIYQIVSNLFSEKTLLESSIPVITKISNTEMIGQFIYTDFLICFLLCGILLLIAMVGAIILTHNFSALRTNEITNKQLARTPVSYNLFK